MNKNIRNAVIATAMLAASFGILPVIDDKKQREEEEKAVKKAAGGLGSLGKTLVDLFYLNRNYRDGRRIGKPGLTFDNLDTYFQDQKGEVHDYTEENAWREISESRTIFAEKISEKLKGIAPKQYENLPASLQLVVNQSMEIIVERAYEEPKKKLYSL